jgi:protein-tyrosine-phosphatase
VEVAFVCIQNAGRSQIATAFAKRERARRGLEEEIEILTGGTRPAISLHDVVLEVMDERGIDLSDRVPRTISKAELADCEYVVAMDRESVRALRDDIEARVDSLFDEIDASASG